MRPHLDDAVVAPARYLHLLAAQLGLIVVYPFVVGTRPSPAVASAILLVIFFAAFRVVAGHRRIRMVATLLVVPTFAVNMLSAARPGRPILVPGIVLGIVFLGFTTVVIFWSVVASRAVTTETLYGAVTAYLLLGITWGWTYALTERLDPGSFRSLVTADGLVAGPDFTYLSFITLTSVGYGDIVPVNAHARSLAILEAIAGQMYLAVFIARLIGMQGPPRETTPRRGGTE